MSKIRVAIVDDHPIFRKGLIAQLKEFDHIEFVGEADSGEEFIDNAGKMKPELVFMDIKMPGMGGIETTAEVLKIYPDMKVVALSMYGEEEYLQQMLDAGAKGFLLKNIDKQELKRAIDAVMKGNSFFSEELLNIMTSLFVSGGSKKNGEDPVILSNRELEVLQLICEGLTNNEIAERLFLSNRTVDGHRANIIGKVGAKNTVSLVTYAIKHKLVKLD